MFRRQREAGPRARRPIGVAALLLSVALLAVDLAAPVAVSADDHHPDNDGNHQTTHGSAGNQSNNQAEENDNQGSGDGGGGGGPGKPIPEPMQVAALPAALVPYAWGFFSGIVTSIVGGLVVDGLTDDDAPDTEINIQECDGCIILGPVVLDLDRNGKFEFVRNIDDEAHKKQLLGADHGWIGTGDGLVMIDANRDGKLDRAEELFLSLLTPDPDDSDLEALETKFDANRDGVFDANDPMFNHSYVWRDRNGNVVGDQGEIKPLTDYVTRITLQTDGQRRVIDNNVIRGQGKLTWKDGRSGRFADAGLWFEGVHRTDLYFAKTINTGTGKVEVHSTSSKSEYAQQSSYVTPIRSADASNGQLLFANMDEDNQPDLVFVKTRSTKSKKVEVHWLSSASDYKRFSHYVTGLETADAANGQFSVSRMDGDSRPDLVFIKTKNVAKGKVEVHWLSGKSGYKSFGGHHATGLMAADAANGQLSLARMDSDNKPDLVFIKTKNVAKGKVEVHWLSSKSGYKSFGGHQVTAFTQGDGSRGSFRLVHFDDDDRPDLSFVKTRQPSSGRIEVHWLTSGSNYKKFGGHYKSNFRLQDSKKGVFQLG